jgi:hypothetical protein
MRRRAKPHTAIAPNAESTAGFPPSNLGIEGSGAKFQLATRYGKRRKHFLRYMVDIFNYSPYLHQSRGYEGQPELREAVEEIGGRRPKIITFTSGSTGASRKLIAAVYFTDDRAEWRRHPQLVMAAICQGEAEQEAAVKTFRSIRWLSPPA